MEAVRGVVRIFSGIAHFQQRVWFDRFEKVPILPNFKGIFFDVIDKIYG